MATEPESDDVMRALLQQSRSLPSLDPARTAQARQTVRAAWLDAAAPRRHARWWMTVAAALVVISVAGYSAWRQSGRLRPEPPATLADALATVRFVTGTLEVGREASRHAAVGDILTANDVLTTGVAGRGTVAWSDAVQVRLDRDTRVRIVAAHRLALERGAVYIDTSLRQGAPVPVEVFAGGTVVRDIGTQYEVRVVSEGMRVRVRDGIAEVARGGETHRATAGSELTVTATAVRRLTVSLFGPEWAWTLQASDAPVIDGRRLAEFLAWVRQESGRAVRFADPTLERTTANATVYGDVRGLSIEEALDIVLPSCGLAHRREGEAILIVSATDPPEAR